MAIESGSRLGPYEILSLIGAGGMGEVYRAKDTRLDRIVAIKVLPSHLSDNAERRERFEREARAVSSLNHPNICTLHDVGEQDGTHFLVMEYIEGETLADRLAKGPLPLDQALRYGIEIADALDKAHRQGVVHRDLKPGNVMLTKPGAKLLDFGLAKFRSSAQEDQALSALPTEEKPLTEKGAILGTFQYMAPEQIEGKEADARTDIFSFGSVLYEMVTGKRAFEGKSQASLIAAIIEREPTPVTELQPMSPPTLERVVEKCLEKDPDDRWQTARDLMDELKWISESGADSDARPQAVAPRKRFALGVVALIVIAALAGYVLGNRPDSSSSTKPLKHLSIQVPSQNLDRFALSRDGSQLAYTGAHDGVIKLHIRSLDQPDVMPIEGTEGASNPFFSPDGQWIGFFAGLKLMKVPTTGGRPTPICDTSIGSFFWGGSWGEDDTIVLGSSSGLKRVSASGGTPQAVTRLSPDGGEIGHRHPEILPTSGSVLFTVWSGSPNTAQITVASLETGDWRVLFEGNSPRFSPTGHIIYWRGDNLYAAPFDLDKLEVVGASVPVLSGVGALYFALAGDGSLVYSESQNEGLVWVDRQGRSTPVSPPVMGHHPRLSPDGRRVAVRIGSDIWIYDLERGSSERLTLKRDNVASVWSPDGRRVAFSSRDVSKLFVKSVDGGSEELLLERDNAPWAHSWSPDDLLALGERDPSTGYDIWILPLEANGGPQPFLVTPFDEDAPIFSPDGRRIAYTSNESGQFEVYLKSYPGPERRWTISTDGGEAPVWSSDGRELFYVRARQMWAVTIETEPEFRAGTPRLLFEGPFDLSTRHPHYDVLPDGRFIMLEQESERSTFNIILNWFDELERLAPAN